MAETKSKLREIVLDEEDFIPGTEIDDLEDHETVLAYDGKKFFTAHVRSVSKKYFSGDVKHARIWQNREIPHTAFVSEDYVQSYITLDKLKEIIPQ